MGSLFKPPEPEKPKPIERASKYREARRRASASGEASTVVAGSGGKQKLGD